MKIFSRLFLSLLANALVLGTAAAAEGEASAGASQKDTATWLDIRASELLGKRVASPDGRALGTVEELVLDVRPEGVHYVVLSHDAGADDKLFVYPLNAFTRAEEKDRLVLHDVRRYNLRLSQGYDGGNWPFDPPLRRASELRGTQVTDPQGEAAGEIEDLVVNLGTGRIEHVVLAQDGRRAAEPKLALPLSALSISPRAGDEVVLRDGRR